MGVARSAQTKKTGTPWNALNWVAVGLGIGLLVIAWFADPVAMQYGFLVIIYLYYGPFTILVILAIPGLVGLVLGVVGLCRRSPNWGLAGMVFHTLHILLYAFMWALPA